VFLIKAEKIAHMLSMTRSAIRKFPLAKNNYVHMHLTNNL